MLETLCVQLKLVLFAFPGIRPRLSVYLPPPSHVCVRSEDEMMCVCVHVCADDTETHTSCSLPEWKLLNIWVWTRTCQSPKPPDFTADKTKTTTAFSVSWLWTLSVQNGAAEAWRGLVVVLLAYRDLIHQRHTRAHRADDLTLENRRRRLFRGCKHTFWVDASRLICRLSSRTRSRSGNIWFNIIYQSFSGGPPLTPTSCV